MSLGTGTTLRTHEAVDVRALAFLDDVDGDGRDDYAVGIPGRSFGIGPGRVEVYSGAGGASLYSLTGSSGYQGLGLALAGIGDVDGDGAGELLIGAPGEPIGPFHTGAAYLVSGAGGAALLRLTAPAATALQYGSSLACPGDYDGDGTDDLAVMHAVTYVGGVVKNFGSIQIWSGAGGALLESMSTVGHYGPLVDAGDVSLDGIHDLLLASPSHGPGSSSILLLGAAPATQTYCYGKQSSGGCTPTIEWTGAPSLSIGDELVLQATQLPARTIAVLQWSLSGFTSPSNYGPLCIAPPFVRARIGSSGGGPGGCSGSLDFTFSRSYLAAQGLTAGSDVFVRGWVRDAGQTRSRPVATTYGLRFTVWP